MPHSLRFPYARQSINEEDKQAVIHALESDLIARGPSIEAFEEAVKEYCGVNYAVAVNSGSTALQAACFAVNASAHDRLVTSPNTFIASVTCGKVYGAEPLLVDIDPFSGNIDIDLVGANALFESTRGKSIYIPVHFAGAAVDMKKMQSLIRESSAVIIEDAAHALGSCYPTGEKVGSCAYSDITILSFHPAKNITTAEGGMLLTNNKEFYERALLFRNNGIEKDPAKMEENPGPWWYESHAFTGNFHMNELQAALGISQLKRLDSFSRAKRKLLEVYREEFAGHPHITATFAPISPHTAYHLAVVLIDFSALQKERKAVMEQLKEEGIGTQVHYIPLYRHPVMKKVMRQSAGIYFPQMESFYEKALSIPLYPDLREEDVREISRKIKDAL